MKIGFSSFVLQGGKSGVAVYIANLLKSLQDVDKVNSYDLLVAESEAGLLPDPTNNFHHKTFRDIIKQPVANILWHNTVLPGYTERNNYDVVHIPSYRRIPARKKCKVVATVHDLAALNIDGKYDRARMFYNRKIVPSLIRECDYIMTVSNYTKNDIIKFTDYPEDKIKVIYSGIDHNIFYPRNKSASQNFLKTKYDIDGPYFVYVSRIEHPAKNHINLIKAFELFKKKNNAPHKLVLAGADWHGADVVKEYANNSSVSDEIIFPGFVPFDEVPIFYSGSDLMVFPSLFEGFGFPIIEAMACGIPVICSNTSSMAELAYGYANTFNPNNFNDICTGIQSAISEFDNELQIACALDYASTFDWSKTAKQVMDVYKACLN